MKIYVITKGIYSDYHICGVAETREKAEQLQKLFDEKDEYDFHRTNIEEYDTEDFSKYLNGYKNYFLKFDKAGNVTHIADDTVNIEWDNSKDIGFDTNKNVFMNVDAKDEASAIKIGAERRAMFFNAQKWKKAAKQLAKNKNIDLDV